MPDVLDPATAKDIPRQQRRAPAKPLEYYLKQSSSRDVGICDAVNAGQHSMTDIANTLGLSVSRVSRIFNKTASEAKGKALFLCAPLWPFTAGVSPVPGAKNLTFVRKK